MENKIVSPPARDYFFDNLKALLIFLVVLCHGIETVRGYSDKIIVLHETILTFLMPLFCFTTGLFSKKMADRDSSKRKQILNIFLLYAICQIMKEVLIGEWHSFFRPIYANWYLEVMIVWYAILPAISRVDRRFMMPLSIAAGVYIGTDPGATALLQLSRLICFFPFFLLGYYCSGDVSALSNKLRQMRRMEFIVLCGCVAFCLYIWVNAVPIGILHANKTYSAMKLTLLQGIGYRIIWYILAAIMGFGVMSFIPGKHFWFSVIGTRTLPIYVFHTIIYAYIRYRTSLFQRIGEGPHTFFVFFVLSIIVTVIFSNKWCESILNHFMRKNFSWFYANIKSDPS